MLSRITLWFAAAQLAVEWRGLQPAGFNLRTYENPQAEARATAILFERKMFHKVSKKN